MSLDDFKHPPFIFVLVPEDINEPPREIRFEGRERNFRDYLLSHFSNEKINTLNAGQFDEFKKGLKDKVQGKLSDEGVDRIVADSANNYQIVPLTLPTKETGFKCINAYIDSVGRIKNLNKNARASRICSTDIRGDCFLSRVFDDEEAFQRIDFTLSDFEDLMKSPPDAKGRWSETKATMDILKKLNPEAAAAALADEEPKPPKCENCGVKNGEEKEGQVVSLKKCGKCGKSFYCGAACQRSDWPLHKRICCQ